MKFFLQTERLILRQFTEEDADNLFELDSDSEVMRFINGGKPTEYKIVQNLVLPKWLNYYEKYKYYGFWAVIEKSSKEFIGWFHFIPAIDNAFAVELKLVTTGEIALGYRLRKSSWGKGYATEGSRALVSKGFSEWNVQRAVSWALVVNKASVRVMEKASLKFENEFMFTENQLPNLQPFEREAVKYGLTKDEFNHEKNIMI